MFCKYDSAEEYWKEIRVQPKRADVSILLRKKKKESKNILAHESWAYDWPEFGSSSPTFSQSVESSGHAGNSVSCVRELQLVLEPSHLGIGEFSGLMVWNP